MESVSGKSEFLHWAVHGYRPLHRYNPTSLDSPGISINEATQFDAKLPPTRAPRRPRLCRRAWAGRPEWGAAGRGRPGDGGHPVG
jgi:hypothetical protein